MTGYRIEFTRRARKDLERSPPWLLERVVELVSTLEGDPTLRVGWDVRRIGGMDGLYRVWVGDYRFVYVVDDVRGVVTVLRVTSRGDAYAD